jgi:hypothetical protein
MTAFVPEMRDIDQIRKDFNTLIARPDFRRFMFWLLEQCQPLQSHFDQNAYAMAYKNGKSDLGKQLMHLLITEAPDKYRQMVNERKSVLDTRKAMNENDTTN